MPTMIEKVAKILFEKNEGQDWSNAESFERDHYHSLAKAAIEAIKPCLTLL